MTDTKPNIIDAKMLKTNLYWFLCLLGMIDIMKQGPQKGAAINIIREVGDKVGYPELKELNFRAMKFMKAKKYWIFKPYWLIVAKRLDRDFDKFKADHDKLAIFYIERHVFGDIMSLAMNLYKELNQLNVHEQNTLWHDLNQANSNITERQLGDIHGIAQQA